jgi:glycine/D-amino acid oxidase-like deaminating enzyme
VPCPDVIIVGLGIYGSALSCELATRGLRVLAFERTAREVVGGSSAGPLRMYRSTPPGDPVLDGMLATALGKWKRLTSGGGPPVFRSLAAASVAESGLEDLGTAHTQLAAPQAGRHVDVAGGLIDAMEAVSLLRRRSEERGASLIFDAVAKVEFAGRRPGVVVNGCRHSADAIVVAVGAGLSDLPRLAEPARLRTMPAYMHVGTWSSGTFREDWQQFYIASGSSELKFCLLPFNDGRRLQFGFSSSGVNRSLSIGQQMLQDRAAALDKLARLVPVLGPASAVRTVPGRYTFAGSSSYYFESVSPGVHVLNVCGGIGFKYALNVADRVADQLF